MRTYDAQGDEINPRPRSPLDVYARFGSGFACKTCGALVAPDEEYAALHTAWHAKGVVTP